MPRCAATAQASALTSLSGPARRALSASFSWTCASRMSPRCRYTQASATAAPEMMCSVRSSLPLLIASAAASARSAARSSLPLRASTSARYPRQSARSYAAATAVVAAPSAKSAAASSRSPAHSSTTPRPASTWASNSGCRACTSPGSWAASACARLDAAVAASRSPVRRASASRISAAASRAGIWLPAGPRPSMLSAASSGAALVSPLPRYSRVAAWTSNGSGCVHTASLGMPPNASASGG